MYVKIKLNNYNLQMNILFNYIVRLLYKYHEVRKYNKKGYSMKKVLVLSVLALFVIGYSVPTFAEITTNSTQPKIQ